MKKYFPFFLSNANILYMSRKASQLYQWGISMGVNVNSVATHKCTVNGLLLKHCRNDMLAVKYYLKFDGKNITTLDLYF